MKKRWRKKRIKIRKLIISYEISNEKDGVPNNERFWRQYNAPVRHASDTPAEERRQILAGTEAVFLLFKNPLQIKGVCIP